MALSSPRWATTSPFLPHSYYRWDEGAGWDVYVGEDELRWYVTDDRHGCISRVKPSTPKAGCGLIGQQLGGDVGLVDGLQAVNFEVYDPQGNLLTSGTAPASSLGGFDLSFELPDNSNLGDAYIQLTATGATPRRWAHLLPLLPDSRVPPPGV